jgi:hypothetical protein
MFIGGLNTANVLALVAEKGIKTSSKEGSEVIKMCFQEKGMNGNGELIYSQTRELPNIEQITCFLRLPVQVRIMYISKLDEVGNHDHACRFVKHELTRVDDCV